MMKRTPHSAMVLILGVLTLLSSAVDLEARSSRQEAPTLSPLATETRMPTHTPFPSEMDRVSAIETQVLLSRLENVESALKELKQEPDWVEFLAPAAGLLTSCQGLIGWVVLPLMVLILFRKEIKALLAELPARLRHSTIKFDKFELTDTDIERVVLDREMLKTMLAVAMADGTPSEAELKYIAQVADERESALDVFSKLDREVVVKMAIRLALADNEFADPEYDAIRRKAIDVYGLTKCELDALVRTACQNHGITQLPRQVER